MAHRGPDGQATWRDDDAGLAFRRLAIIDLDERSISRCTSARWHLVFNGEIYDYRELREELRALGHAFGTEGDGEVLLHAWDEWGEGALDRLDGMFAFAIWHDERRELVAGQRPVRREARLLVRSTADASSSPPTSARCCRPGPTSARRAPRRSPPYVAPRPDAADRRARFFAGVHRLPGGHLLRFGDGARVRAALLDAARGPGPGRATRTPWPSCASCCSDSVRRRLRADVPVGTSLSGGVDSSAIVAPAGAARADRPPPRLHRRASPASSATSGASRTRPRRPPGVIDHHAIEPTLEDAARGPRALSPPRRSRSAP